MNISKEQVEYVARLARLELTEEEKEKYTQQLNSILGYVRMLEKLDTSAVEPLAHVLPLQNVFRPDETGECLTPDEVLDNAPERLGDFFKVPKIV